MVISEIQFLQELHREHLLETGHLLTQRQRYLEDPAISWLGVADLEDRLAAHVDALELGGDLAKQCAVEFLKSSDEDEITGAVHALASIHFAEISHLEILLEHFIQADDALFGCYVEALKHATHPQLSHYLTPLLTHERPILNAAAAEILGFRRVGDAKRLWPMLRHPDGMVRGTAIVALVRMGDRSAVPALEQSILDSDSPPPQVWLLPLLLLGSRRALREVATDSSRAGSATPVGLSCLAMAGGRETFVILARAIQYPDMKPHAYAALGIFGDVNGVAHLLDGLRSADDNERLEAAKALQLITGAGLIETVTVEEREEPDLIPEDVTGEPKQTPSEEPPPRTRQVQRVCTRLEPWQRWWQEHARNFNMAPRWRHGKPFSLGLCIDDLAHPDSDYQTRQHAYMELLIRSGQSIAFEPDWFISRQTQAIEIWRAWWQGTEASYTNRPWTFDGH